MIEKFLEGNHAFVIGEFARRKDFYTGLAKGQSPKVLWIGCVDSRVTPERITSAEAGELFVHRNIGNIVPHASWTFATVLEYAIKHLKIEEIVVCGHSDCGALKALYKGRDRFANSPHILEWLRNGDRTLRVVQENYPGKSREEQIEITFEENVLVQMENLRTYPVVQEAAREGKLHIHAWFFDIGTGTVFQYDPGKEQFEAIREERE